MPQIDLEIRQQLFAHSPGLSLSAADSMIRDIGACYFDILADSEALGKGEWRDFISFTCLDELHLLTTYRREEIEFWIFKADGSFVSKSEAFAMVDIDEHYSLAKAKARGGISVLRFSMALALPWMTAQAREKE